MIRVSTVSFWIGSWRPPRSWRRATPWTTTTFSEPWTGSLHLMYFILKWFKSCKFYSLYEKNWRDFLDIHYRIYSLRLFRIQGCSSFFLLLFPLYSLFSPLSSPLQEFLCGHLRWMFWGEGTLPLPLPWIRLLFVSVTSIFSKVHYEKILKYVDIATEEGGNILIGQGVDR